MYQNNLKHGYTGYAWLYWVITIIVRLPGAVDSWA